MFYILPVIFTLKISVTVAEVVNAMAFSLAAIFSNCHEL